LDGGQEARVAGESPRRVGRAVEVVLHKRDGLEDCFGDAAFEQLADLLVAQPEVVHQEQRVVALDSSEDRLAPLLDGVVAPPAVEAVGEDLLREVSRDACRLEVFVVERVEAVAAGVREVDGQTEGFVEDLVIQG
jgi:hypothetical protein